MRPPATRTPVGEPPGWGAWLLRFALAFVLLNALLTFEHTWPAFGFRPGARLSFELCFGLLLLTPIVAWRGRLGAGWVGGLTAALCVMIFVRAVDVVSDALFGRPVQLYWDGRHALDALDLAGGHVAGWPIALGALGMGLGVAALASLVRWCVRSLVDSLAWHRPRPWLLAAGSALTLSFAAHPYVHRDTRWFFSMPVGPVLWHQAEMLPFWIGRGETSLTPSPRFDGNAAALKGADVLLVFAEAYGMTSFDDATLAARLAAPRAHLREQLQAAGWQAASARVRSPTFGGGSWLAHAALLTGVDTHRPDDYERLLASRRPSLVGWFHAQGYRTVGWMPGLQRPWPEGAFYGFDRRAGGDAIGYRGPAFGYWRIPDQASVALLQQQELAGTNRAPRFIVFPTVSTHAPFRPLAPYREDWQRLLGSDAYSAHEAADALAQPVSWLAPREAYAQSLAYTFDWLGAYLAGHASEHLLVIVVGDHQPIASVTGPAASWDVPVHVISRDPLLLKRFEALGFIDGLEPAPHPLGGLHELTSMLLQAFEAPPGVAAAEAAPVR